MRPIDADALFSIAAEEGYVTVDDIISAPTIDPVRHARWVCHPDPTKFALVCSACGQVMPFVPEHLPNVPPYCNCGAKMDGKEGV